MRVSDVYWFENAAIGLVLGILVLRCFVLDIWGYKSFMKYCSFRHFVAKDGTNCGRWLRK